MQPSGTTEHLRYHRTPQVPQNTSVKLTEADFNDSFCFLFNWNLILFDGTTLCIMYHMFAAGQ